MCTKIPQPPKKNNFTNQESNPRNLSICTSKKYNNKCKSISFRLTFRPIPGQVMHCFAFIFQTLKVTIPTSRLNKSPRYCWSYNVVTSWRGPHGHMTAKKKLKKKKRFELISFMWGWVETVQGGKETQKLKHVNASWRVNKNYLQPTVVTINKYISQKNTWTQLSLGASGCGDSWQCCLVVTLYWDAPLGLFHSGDDVHSAELSCTHTHIHIYIYMCTYKNDKNALHR